MTSFLIYNVFLCQRNIETKLILAEMGVFRNRMDGELQICTIRS